MVMAFSPGHALTDLTTPLGPLAPQRALRLLWAAVAVTLVDYVVGGGWDAEYHRTHVFDGFFSPPHIFIYTLVTVLIVLVGVIVVDPRLRGCFPPGALVLLVGGCAGFALAGPLDAIWHTAFGLDETNWSLPHAMLGQTLGLLVVGFLACRRGLEWHQPAWWPTWYLLGYLVVFAAISVLGPIGDNPSIESARRTGSLGELANDADYQHLVRIVVEADLTHANPAFPLLAAWWCALTIAILRGLDSRVRYWFVVALLVGLSLVSATAGEAEELGLTADEATTSLPMLTALLVFALGWRMRETTRYALAGLAVGAHTWAVWGSSHPTPYAVAALLTPATAVLGHRLGRWIAELLRHPAPTDAKKLVIGMILVVPLITGAVDLALRLAID
jgi:hypothetical protein